jgi:hypothetical protein
MNKIDKKIKCLVQGFILLHYQLIEKENIQFQNLRIFLREISIVQWAEHKQNRIKGHNVEIMTYLKHVYLLMENIHYLKCKTVLREDSEQV